MMHNMMRGTIIIETLEEKNKVKTFMIDILKVLVGTVIGVGIVIFTMSLIIEKLLFWVIPIMIVLFIMIIAIALNLGVKPTLIVIGSFVFGWLGFNPYYKYTCGPNSADVKVMKPMAEKISDYIIKNGIPKSLKDIPDLPYGLVGCENRSYYQGEYDEKMMNYIKLPSQNEANSKLIQQKCHFYYLSKIYKIDIHGGYGINVGGDLYMNIDANSDTGMQYYFSIDKNEKIYYKHSGAYSSKSDGICKPWKQ